MWPIDAIAEQRITEAMERGELDNLEGTGRPLDLRDDVLVPEEMRACYRLLKNAGYVPPEVRTLKEIGELETLIRRSADPQQRDSAWKRLVLLQAALGERRSPGLAVDAYRDKLLGSFRRP